MILLICCIATFFACIMGTICGMGGGIIIKPVLDATGVMSVASITFLSGVTVISMSFWSVLKNILNKESVLEFKTTGVLAVGASVGGLVGKQLFSLVSGLFADKNTAGGVQATLLLIATAATLVYTLNQNKLKHKNIKSPIAELFIGLVLGMIGSFLGIGGGPFNVAVLTYFFSMPVKKATQNSLLIVLCSQLTSVVKTVAFDGIPEFVPVILIGMVAAGVVGSEIGRRISKKINNRQATVWIECVLVAVIAVNIYNIIKFFG